MKRRLQDLSAALAWWPALRVDIQLTPWHWQLKPRFYSDSHGGARSFFHLSWLGVGIIWYGAEPDEVMFPLGRSPAGGRRRR